eukprot:TRINITY_DN13016_c0_g1_i1.p1 TRINITY_DN13016_c0_g1~~TRINITY_DN13016_c0_g1_i1.p1  ORF type:complete len:472 (-),score=82.09 TRINITY_DN13016_c0_g1_i1:617-2032(-)
MDQPLSPTGAIGEKSVLTPSVPWVDFSRRSHVYVAFLSALIALLTLPNVFFMPPSFLTQYLTVHSTVIHAIVAVGIDLLAAPILSRIRLWLLRRTKYRESEYDGGNRESRADFNRSPFGTAAILVEALCIAVVAADLCRRLCASGYIPESVSSDQLASVGYTVFLLNAGDILRRRYLARALVPLGIPARARAMVSEHFVSYALYVVAGARVLVLVGLPLESVMTAAGVSGFAVGFASKELLTNMFGGVLLFCQRPFGEGDWIEIGDPSGGGTPAARGTVRRVGLLHTTVAAADSTPSAVPNAAFLHSVITNRSLIEFRRFEGTVRLQHADVPRVTAVAAAVCARLRAVPVVSPDHDVLVGLRSLEADHAAVEVIAHTAPMGYAAWVSARHDIWVAVAAGMADAKAPFAEPPRMMVCPTSGGCKAADADGPMAHAIPAGVSATRSSEDVQQADPAGEAAVVAGGCRRRSQLR